MTTTPSTPLAHYRRGDLVEVLAEGFTSTGYVLADIRTMENELRYVIQYNGIALLVVRPEQIALKIG